MKVCEEGQLGPLPARKVKGFRRTLISVAGLVDLPQVDKVVFSSAGVHLHGRNGGAPVRIGSRMSNNLFSFDGVEAVARLQAPTSATIRSMGERRQ